MATYEELDAGLKADLQSFMQLARPVTGELARLCYRLNVTKAAYASLDIGAIMALLDADALVPNESGLAGAVDISKAQLSAFLAQLNAVLIDNYDADDLERYVAFAGAANVIGG